MNDFIEEPKRKWWKQEPKHNDFIEVLRGIPEAFRGVPVREVVGGIVFLLLLFAVVWLGFAL